MTKKVLRQCAIKALIYFFTATGALMCLKLSFNGLHLQHPMATLFSAIFHWHLAMKKQRSWAKMASASQLYSS